MGEPLKPDDPRTLGRFTLRERLGEGGQGIVYLGLDPESGERVAVKVLKAADAEARQRLEREMNAVQRVRRRFCIARVIDFSFEGQRPFVVSEYVEGPSLYERVAQSGPLRDGDLERLLVNTATALIAIHQSGVVHRDLKPANVLLGPDGPRVVDFGIARPVDQHTRSGQLVGTPSYFAPEQLNGVPASQASDIWAWACTMVFAATAFPPFGPFPDDGPNIAAILSRIIREEPRLGHGLDEWEPLLKRCLDKDPARRPTARQVHDLILESDLDIEPPPVPAEPPVSSWQPPPTPGFPAAAPSIPPRPPADLPGAVPLGTPQPPSSWRPPGPPGSRDFTQERTPEPSIPEALPPEPSVPPRFQETIPPGNTPPPFSATPPPFPTTPPPFPGVPARPPAGRRRSKTGPVLAGLVVVLLLAGGGFWFLGREGGPGGGSGIPASFKGTWTGEVRVSNGLYGNHSYATSLTLYEGDTSADAQLTGPSVCPLTLGYQSTKGSSLVFDATGGIAKECPSGKITLTRDGDKIAFRITGPGPVTGDGTLTKQN
ncbi:serine/threonine protein kinase [Actinocorallia longicatena]|uniref:Protein kinase domain-containing protein n=1 Tax=Actinocorallia longicatena TaxID=111803 RepID=A0ABP6PZR2_9ACTN